MYIYICTSGIYTFILSFVVPCISLCMDMQRSRPIVIFSIIVSPVSETPCNVVSSTN